MQGIPVIREVTPNDFAAIRALVELAFADSQPAETVKFLDDLRTDACIAGEWVAETGGLLLGHVAFSRVWIENANGSAAACLLSPLSVRPSHQRTGIGTRLSRYALLNLEQQGERIFFVLGHPAFYPRLGFSRELALNIESPWSAKPAFMARGEAIPAGRLILPRSIANAH